MEEDGKNTFNIRCSTETIYCVTKLSFLFLPFSQETTAHQKKKLSKLPGEDKWRRQRQLLSTPRNFFFKDVENKSKNKFVGKEKSRSREEWSINNTTKKGRRLESKKISLLILTSAFFGGLRPVHKSVANSQIEWQSTVLQHVRKLEI